MIRIYSILPLLIISLLGQIQVFSQSVLSTNPLLQLDLESAYETRAFLNFHRTPATQVLPLFLAISPQAHPIEEDNIRKELNAFITLLKKKQSAYKDDERFLNYMFYKVHRKFLKHYSRYPDFLSLFKRGQYDCVTGTALYAYMLDSLGYTYSIQEREYHIYLLVTPQIAQNEQHTGTDLFLIESTDPLYGFVSESSAIQERIQWYESEGTSTTSNADFQYNFEIDNTINLVELAGLAYYNAAVAHYNRQQFSKAIVQLKKAKFLYESQRMNAFMSLIDNTLASMPQSNLTH